MPRFARIHFASKQLPTLIHQHSEAMPTLKGEMAYFDLPTAHKDGTKNITCGDYPREPLINGDANLAAGFTKAQLSGGLTLPYKSDYTQGLRAGLPFFKRSRDERGLAGPWFPYNNFEVVDMRALRTRLHWDIWLHVEFSFAFIFHRCDQNTISLVVIPTELYLTVFILTEPPHHLGAGLLLYYEVAPPASKESKPAMGLVTRHSEASFSRTCLVHRFDFK